MYKLVSNNVTYLLKDERTNQKTHNLQYSIFPSKPGTVLLKSPKIQSYFYYLHNILSNNWNIELYENMIYINYQSML